MTSRPGGVTALAVVLFIIGVLLFSLATYMGFSLALSTILTENIQAIAPFLFGVFYIPSGLPANIFFLYVYTFLYVEFQLNFGVYQMQTVGIDIVAMIYVFAAIGLFRMKRWGRYLALIFGVVMIPALFGIVVVVYLMGSVKYDFE
ncbi:MAG: hypothetical protein WED07_16000 [Candidatus Freyarchaeum deiterrae]